MAAVSQVSSSLFTSIAVPRLQVADVYVSSPARSLRIGTSFSTGSPLMIRGTTCQRTVAQKATAISIRCEQGTKEGSGLDIWLGRLGMVGFAAAIGVEVSTGKGLLENFGLTSSLPTVALAVTLLIIVLTAIFIFQSASEK